MRLKSFLLAAALVAAGVSATAQTEVVYEDAHHWFMGVKGGAQVVPSNYSFSSLIAPAVGLEIGRQFTPSFGVRLDVQGLWSKTGFPTPDVVESFSYVTGDLDLLFNVTNMLMSRPHAFDASLVLGAGLNYSWDAEAAGNHPMDDRGHLLAHESLTSHNLRAGVLFGYSLCRNWALNLEVDANNLDDKFNSKWSGHNDWQYTAMLGATYRWGHKSHIVERERVTEPEPAPAPVERTCDTCGKLLSRCEYNGNHPAQPAVVYKSPSEIHIEIFFDLDKSNIRASEDAKLRGLSNFIREHEVGTVVVKAYADRKTGNPDYNQKLSERRAETIVNELTSTYHIPAARIQSEAYGDKVQPFAENAMNRVVIIDVKEK